MNRLKKLMVSLIAIVMLTSGLAIAGTATASADTKGYARITVSKYRQVSIEFGIPKWATSNTASRKVAKGGCTAFLGSKLPWWTWIATDFACGVAIDRFWKPNKGMSVCGKIPVANIWKTRVWQC